MAFNADQFGSGLGGFLGGLFGDSGAPYEKAMQQFTQFGNRAQQAQNPFLQAGTGAIPQFQQWLSGMQNPSGFINNLMGKYQESPWAKFQQDQMMRAAQNAGSRGDTIVGGIGSTPMAQFMQQNARDISSQDMNQWLQHALGVNTQYGSGLGGLIGSGQGSANSLTDLYSHMGDIMGNAAYGQEKEGQQDFWNMLGGLGQMAGPLLGLFA